MRSKKCRSLVDLERPFEAEFFFSDGCSEIVAVNLCVCRSVRKRLERAFGIRSNSADLQMRHQKLFTLARHLSVGHFSK